jgi:DNA-binding NtrC family response regulator
LASHILVVEDELNMCRTLSLILKRAGYSVSQAKGGREALKIIVDSKNRTPMVDLLITDILMPGLTVMELLAELDRLNIFVPVLITTSLDNKNTTIGLRYKSYIKFIEKPFNAEEFIEHVSHLLKKKLPAQKR